MSLETIRELVKETIESMQCYVMQIDSRGVKSHVKKKDGSDWTGTRVEAEVLAKRLGRKTLAKRMNFHYSVETVV